MSLSSEEQCSIKETNNQSIKMTIENHNHQHHHQAISDCQLNDSSHEHKPQPSPTDNNNNHNHNHNNIALSVEEDSEFLARFSPTNSAPSSPFSGKDKHQREYPELIEKPTNNVGSEPSEDFKSSGEAVEQQNYELRFLVRRREAGALIGKKGANIKRLRETFKSSMFSIPDTGNGPERVVCIMTPEKFLDDILTDFTQLLMEKSPENDEQIELKLLIHSSHAGSIIGIGGQSIKKLRNDSKAAIKIYEMCCPLSNERVCAIKAKPNIVVNTIKLILAIFNENPIKGTIKPYDALNFDLNLIDKYGGYSLEDTLQLMDHPFNNQHNTLNYHPHAHLSHLHRLQKHQQQSIQDPQAPLPSALNRIRPLSHYCHQSIPIPAAMQAYMASSRLAAGQTPTPRLPVSYPLGPLSPYSRHLLEQQQQRALRETQAAPKGYLTKNQNYSIWRAGEPSSVTPEVHEETLPIAGAPSSQDLASSGADAKDLIKGAQSIGTKQLLPSALQKQRYQSGKGRAGNNNLGPVSSANSSAIHQRLHPYPTVGRPNGARHLRGQPQAGSVPNYLQLQQRQFQRNFNFEQANNLEELAQMEGLLDGNGEPRPYLCMFYPSIRANHQQNGHFAAIHRSPRHNPTIQAANATGIQIDPATGQSSSWLQQVQQYSLPYSGIVSNSIGIRMGPTTQNEVESCSTNSDRTSPITSDSYKKREPPKIN